MFATECFDHLGDFFFLFQGCFVAGRLFRVDAVQEVTQVLPRFGTLDDRYGLEENAALDGFGFEIGPFLQRKLLPQFSGESNLSGTAQFHQWHGVGCSLG
jgi:hypothetical protein